MKTIIDVKDEAISYPEGYYDFTDGVSISNDRIRSFILREIELAVEKLKKENLKETFSTIGTGNTKVFIEIYKQENGLLTIDVSVSRSFKSKAYVDVNYLTS